MKVKSESVVGGVGYTWHSFVFLYFNISSLIESYQLYYTKFPIDLINRKAVTSKIKI